MALVRNPNKITVVAGTDVSSDHKDTYHDDANVVEVTEVAATPGFTVDFTFDKFRVDNYFVTYLQLYILGWYDGNVSHDVKIYIYNWLTESWDGFTSDDADIPDTAAEAEYTFLKKMGPGLSSGLNGTVLIRIQHDSAGTGGEDLYVNKMELSGIILGSIHGAGQV